jgi:thiol-disulfide isomerase/thioredoxin
MIYLSVAEDMDMLELKKMELMTYLKKNKMVIVHLYQSNSIVSFLMDGLISELRCELPSRIKMVRMEGEEYPFLTNGIYPKLIVFEDGKKVKEMNGFKSSSRILQEINEIYNPTEIIEKSA